MAAAATSNNDLEMSHQEQFPARGGASSDRTAWPRGFRHYLWMVEGTIALQLLAQERMMESCSSDWHFCFICNKTAKFHCFCCPNAVCGQCIPDAEFIVVRGIKGFCINCLRLALLWEERKEVDSDGGKVDFKERGTQEFLFMDYWEIIKKDEGLKLEHLQRAHDLLKRGRNYRSFDDIDEFARNDQNVLNLTNYEDWEWEAVEEYSPSRCAKRKRSKHVKKRKTSILQPKQKAKCNKKEFVGWGSKPLIDFLASVGVDASKELSHYKVMNIVMEHVEKKKLLHPKRKKMILCDQYLQSLLGRKLVNKFRVHGLLEAHFAKSLENTEKGDWCSSEEKSDGVLTHCKRKRNKNSNGNQNQDGVISRDSTTAITPAIAPPPRIVAIVPENINLIYLRRSLVEKLLKQTKNVEAKVIGSFVRVKSDPNNYLQQHPYQLVQVIGKHPME
ncbi:hypothetical protein Cgig2_001613 [Carnegiea gigantea]|uniref:Uncharacterized protein n=1 Tax=Carnegiea gigantea TaxID=171969 RepID=A0A9Q1GJV3_9CARY|nr:hypothetical protein Cgig2_001613 [Carnegiea gigantea]